MEEYYTLEVKVTFHKHPEGVPQHNNRQVVEVADFKIRDNSLEDLIIRGNKHIALIDE